MFVSAGICGANIAKRRRVYVLSESNIKATQVSKGREPFGGVLSVPFCRHGQKGTSSARRRSSVPRRAGACSRRRSPRFLVVSMYFSLHGERKVPKEPRLRKKPTVSSLGIYLPDVRARRGTAG